MGLMSHMSCGTYAPEAPPVKAPNPDPRQFTIVSHEQVGEHLVVCIAYPNCTTYEGRKVMVFQNTKIGDLRRLKMIDPHFTDSAPGVRVPMARFHPTTHGWRLARIVAAAL